MHGTLYSTYVIPITQYRSVIWGFQEVTGHQVLHNGVGHCYLGVHKFAWIPGTHNNGLVRYEVVEKG